jgi:hypothetical protein
VLDQEVEEGRSVVDSQMKILNVRGLGATENELCSTRKLCSDTTKFINWVMRDFSMINVCCGTRRSNGLPEIRINLVGAMYSLK